MEGVWRCIAGVRFAQNSQFWGSSILRVSFFRIVFWLVAEQYEQTLPLLLYITIAGIGTMCFPHSFIWVNFHQKDWGVRVQGPVGTQHRSVTTVHTMQVQKGINQVVFPKKCKGDVEVLVSWWREPHPSDPEVGLKKVKAFLKTMVSVSIGVRLLWRFCSEILREFKL